LRQLAADIGAGDELHSTRRVAAGQGNAGLRSRDAGRGDAGNDFVADAGLAQRLELLLEPAENAGVARLQANHPNAGRRIVDQQPVNVVLLGRRTASSFAHRDEIGAGPGEIENRTGREVVVENDVRLPQPRGALQREQLGIAGAGRDEGNKAAHRSSAIKWKNVPVTRPRCEPVSAMTAPVASCTIASGVSGWARMVE